MKKTKLRGFGRTFANQESLDLFASIWWEGESLSDCIWKLNGQISDLRKDELSKLDAYFPEEGPDRALRWRLESRKLDYSFPLFLNYSFVTTTFALTEAFLIKTCELVHLITGSPIRVRQLAGSKLDRCFDYLRHFGGLDTNLLELYEPIKALSSIRNCIVHAAGFVRESRDDRELRQIISERKYLSKTHRLRRDELDKRDGKTRQPEIIIVEDHNAERLFLREDYAHVAGGYFRNLLFEIFEQTKLASSFSEAGTPKKRRRKSG